MPERINYQWLESSYNLIRRRRTQSVVAKAFSKRLIDQHTHLLRINSSPVLYSTRMSNNDANRCISIREDEGNENTTSNMVDSTRLLRRTIISNDDVEAGYDSTIPTSNKQQGFYSSSFHNVERPVSSPPKKNAPYFRSCSLHRFLSPFG